MILAFDTYYFEEKAKTVCLSFKYWTDSEPIQIIEDFIDVVADYEPGEFYKRELPCITNILDKKSHEDIETIIVDGFVYLSDDKKLGLGGYLYNYLNMRIPIIGVAKSGFRNNKKNVKELLRGESIKPLFISSIGIELEDAYEKIKSMNGKYRMPTLLQLLDSKTKEKTVGNNKYT